MFDACWTCLRFRFLDVSKGVYIFPALFRFSFLDLCLAFVDGVRYVCLICCMSLKDFESVDGRYGCWGVSCVSVGLFIYFHMC